MDKTLTEPAPGLLSTLLRPGALCKPLKGSKSSPGHGVANGAASHIVIIEDDAPSRQALSQLLALNGHRKQCYASADDYLSQPPRNPVDCILLDLRLPGTGGMEFLQLESVRRGPPVVVITGHAEIALAVQAMKLGAVDFLEKPIDRDQLLRAITSALRSSPDHEATRLLGTLTRRESEIAELIAAGRTSREIASQLDVSYRTVECHRGHILEKLNAANAAELVRTMMLARSSL